MYQDPERYARASMHKPCGSNRLLRLIGKTRVPQKRDLRVRILQQPSKKRSDNSSANFTDTHVRAFQTFDEHASCAPKLLWDQTETSDKKQTQHRFAAGSHPDIRLSCPDRSKMRNKFELSDVYTHTCQSRLGAMLTREATLKCGRFVDRMQLTIQM